MKKSTEQLLLLGALAAGGYYLWKKHQAQAALVVSPAATATTPTLMIAPASPPIMAVPVVTQPTGNAIALVPTSSDDDLEVGSGWLWGPGALVGGHSHRGGRRGGHGRGR